MENMEKECLSFSYDKNDVHYNIRIEEISNGFIVCIYKSWHEGEGDKREYKSEETKTYYKENPLKEETKIDKKEGEKTGETLKSLSTFMNRIEPLMNY